MTEHNMEKSIFSAIDKMTPDILEDLIQELDMPEEPERSMSEAIRETEPEYSRKRKVSQGRRWRKAMAGCAAALALVIGGAAYMNSVNDAFAVVGLDVNPSIEININKDEKVVSVKAVNDDGGDIVGDMDLKGTDLDVACNAIIGAMVTRGYLTDTSNALLISVNSKDEAKGRELEQRISEELQTYIGDSKIDPAIIGQYVEADSSIEAFAEDNGISYGKAWLIKKLLETGSTKMTEESLLQISTHDLIFLGQKRHVESDVSYGEADSSDFIGDEKALEIALGETGLSREQIDNLKIDFDCESGSIIYEAEFTSGGQEYELDINARTGEIVSSEIERVDADDDSDDDDIDDEDGRDGYDNDKDDDGDSDDDDDDDNDIDDED